MFFAILIIFIVFFGFLFVVGSVAGTSLFCAVEKGKQESKKEAKEILEGKRPVPERQRLNQLIDLIKSQSTQEEDRDLVEDLRNLKKEGIRQTKDFEDKIIKKQSTEPKEKENYGCFHVIVGLFFLFMIFAGIIGSGDDDKANTPTNVSQSQQETSKTIKFVDNSNGLRLRDKPSLSAEILEVLEDKTKVEVLAKKDEWTQVKIGSKQGWVASKYLAISQRKTAKKIEPEQDNTTLTVEKADFKITAEEIYSNYLRCQKDSSFEDVIHKKYNGKIVEITGIVEEITDLYKDTYAAKQGVDTSKYIDKDERYVVCLADNKGHACVAWVYSSSPQLINNIKVGNKISVIGRWVAFEGVGAVPDLMDSEIKKIY